MRIADDGPAPAPDLNRRIVIYGASGHASVVLDVLMQQGANIVGLLEDNTDSHRSVFGIPVIGDRSALAGLLRDGVRVIHIAIGNNRARRRISQICEEMGFELLTLSHRTAVIGRDSNLGAGCFIAANTVIGPRAVLGTCCVINHGTTIDHDCVLGNAVHAAPGSHLAGHVRIGDETLIGVGSTVKDRVTIGSNATIGAGSVVIANIPDRAVAFGVPARIKTEI